MMLLSTARSVSCSMPLKHRSRSLHVGRTQSVVNYVHEANSDVTRRGLMIICGHWHKALLSMNFGSSHSHSHLTPTEGIFPGVR